MNWKEDNALLWTGTMHIPSKLEPCFPRAVWAVCLNRAAFQKPVGSPPAGLNGTPNLAETEQCASYVWYFPKELKQQAAIKGNLFKINLKNTKAHICLKWKKKTQQPKTNTPKLFHSINGKPNHFPFPQMIAVFSFALPSQAEVSEKIALCFQSIWMHLNLQF